MLISSEKKTNIRNEVKQSAGWEFVKKKKKIISKKKKKMVPKRGNKHSKLLGLLQTESLITSQGLV